MKRALLLLLLLLPLAYVDAGSFVMSPKYVTLMDWVSFAPAKVNITFWSPSGSTNLSFKCPSNIKPPDNGTMIDATQKNLTFEIDRSKTYNGLFTCTVSSDTMIDYITFEIWIDKLENGITLSKDSIQIAQEKGKVSQYVIYATSSYNFTDAKVYQRYAPNWVSLQTTTVPRKSSVPIYLNIDTRNLPTGIVYGTLYYAYNVSNKVAGLGKIEITLNVTPVITPSQYYNLTVQVVNEEYKPVQGAAVFISSSSDSVILFTDANGMASRSFRSGVYNVNVKYQGYEEVSDSIVLDSNKVRLYSLKKVQNTTTTTPSGNTTSNLGTLDIKLYSVSLRVTRGTTNSASIPISAKGGSVTLSLTPVVSQPDWISASLSSTQLLEGQTGFIVVTASPPNTTTLGNYTKQFYLAYNDKVAVITANVSVIYEKSNASTNIPFYNKTIPRPSYLKVPIVSVILRGTEGVTNQQPIQCAMNDIVYVTVQGDYSLVRLKPSNLALLGAEPRADGIVYRYQVKGNGELNVELVYYNPITGLESTETPQEYGYGRYVFQVVENPEAAAQKNAYMFVTIGSGFETSIDTTITIPVEAFIYYPNGTKVAVEGSIQFQPTYAYTNMSFTPSATLTAGRGYLNFRYAGTYIPQKPQWWNGDFRVNIMQLEVRPAIIEWKDTKQYTTDDKIVYNLADFGMDVYRVQITPSAHYNLQGTQLTIVPEADVSYTITVYGYLYKSFQNVAADRDVELRIYTMKVTQGTSATFYNVGVPLIVGAVGFFLLRFFYSNISSRRARRPWEG